MNAKELDAQINQLIVDLVPYLFEDTTLSREGLNIIGKNLELNNQLKSGIVSMQDAMNDKRKMISYLTKMIDYAEVQKEKNDSIPADAEEVFADLVSKTNTI